MTLPASAFRDHIQALSPLAPIVTFKTDGKIFIMEVNPDFGQAMRIIRPSNDNMQFIQKKDCRRTDDRITPRGMFEASVGQEECQQGEKQQEEQEEQAERTDQKTVDELSEQQEVSGSEQQEDVEMIKDKPEDPEECIMQEEDESEEMKKPKVKKPASRSYKTRHTIDFVGKVISATHIMKYFISFYFFTNQISQSILQGHTALQIRVHVFRRRTTFGSQLRYQWNRDSYLLRNRPLVLKTQSHFLALRCF
jgi:hypothetical protein